MANIIYLLLAYLFFCKVWPYCLYPNYLLRSRIERYPELIKLASELRSADKYQTVENVYRYMQDTYTGHTDLLKVRSLLSVFQLGDFSTKEMIDKNQFLWCHNQNRLFKSILVNTGMFADDEIQIKRRLVRSFFMHQWLSLEFDGKRITVDPYYGIFKARSI
ncbi:MAG: hypothetical protein WC050_03680 [Candidatus Paceibacterota bacterium]